MSIRTHAPHCAKTRALIESEEDSTGRRHVECTCGATYEPGVASQSIVIGDADLIRQLSEHQGRFRQLDDTVVRLRELVRCAQHHVPRSWPQCGDWLSEALAVLGEPYAFTGSGVLQLEVSDG